MKKSEIFYSALKVPLDFVLTALAFHAAYFLRLKIDFGKELDLSLFPEAELLFWSSVIGAATLVLVFTLNRNYAMKNRNSASEEAKKTFSSWLIWIMLIISYYFFTRELPYSRLAIFYTWGLTLIFLLGHRTIIQIIKNSLLKSGIGQTKTLIIGDNKVSEILENYFKKNPKYCLIKGENTNSLNQIEYIAKKEKIDQIIQTKSHANHVENEALLEFCEANHIEYIFVPDLLEVKTLNVEVETIAGIPIIHMKPTPLEGWSKVTKRIMDIILSFSALIVLSPILLITAIAIKIDSKGPILFSKLEDGSPVKRIGQRGKPFNFLKFRSMRHNSHQERYTVLAEKNHRSEGPLIKIKNDPRITKVGKFIRRFSIDEFPQLWNVLLGHMSLVGPRPHLPEEVSKYEKHHKFVLTIKPGMSGLAQISGRSDLSFEEEVKLDRYYIENWSILLDLKIIFRTFAVIFKKYEE